MENSRYLWTKKADRMSRKRIVVKVGTNVLTQADGKLDVTALSQLVDQLVAIKQQGIEVVLVSSGAVGAGRSIYEASKQLSKVVQRQVCSAIGQVQLMQWYAQLLSNYRIHCAQVLATKEDFRDRQHYLNMQNCLLALLRDHLVPIVNENDVVSINELMFTDNDELASLIAAMINADTLILLTAVDGLFNGDPTDKSSQLIERVEADDTTLHEFILPQKSSFGRGGMATKIRMAQKTAALGIEVVIANGKRADILNTIFKGQYVGTTFPAATPISNVKKWMAHQHHSTDLPEVIINEGAVDRLRSKSTISSLLPIGVVTLKGDFEKGDLLTIKSTTGERIGIGMAQYDSVIALDALGKTDRKELIHYDYLYIE
jgi:glutamate 5-kinase